MKRYARLATLTLKAIALLPRLIADQHRDDQHRTQQARNYRNIDHRLARLTHDDITELGHCPGCFTLDVKGPLIDHGRSCAWIDAKLAAFTP